MKMIVQVKKADPLCTLKGSGPFYLRRATYAGAPVELKVTAQKDHAETFLCPNGAAKYATRMGLTQFEVIEFPG